MVSCLPSLHPSSPAKDAFTTDKKAYEMFARQWGLGDNPLDDIRDPDVPVGLKVRDKPISSHSITALTISETLQEPRCYLLC